jgi:hypothetical protein
MACRYCDLRGIYSNHIYYPAIPPSDKTKKTYDLLNLPKRTHKDYEMRIEQVVTKPPSKTRDTLASNLGN